MKIIYLEDDDADFGAYGRALVRRGHQVERAATLEELETKLVAHGNADVVLCDVEGYGDQTGLDWAKAYTEKPGHKPVVAMSNSSGWKASAGEAKIPFMIKGDGLNGLSFADSLVATLTQAVSSHNQAAGGALDVVKEAAPNQSAIDREDTPPRG